jgi:rubrerythrin
MKKVFATPQEILEEFRAILQLEKKAANVYHQLAQECGDEEVGKMLEKISQDERAHVEIAQTLFELVQRLVEHMEWPGQIDLDPLKHLNHSPRRDG